MVSPLPFILSPGDSEFCLSQKSIYVPTRILAYWRFLFCTVPSSASPAAVLSYDLIGSALAFFLDGVELIVWYDHRMGTDGYILFFLAFIRCSLHFREWCCVGFDHKHIAAVLFSCKHLFDTALGPCHFSTWRWNMPTFQFPYRSRTDCQHL